MRDQEGVDAAGVGLEVAARLRRQRGERALGIAVEVERAQKHIGGEGALAEQLREPALTGAARQLHLPQPILGVQEAERAEHVLHGLRKDVRHALAVAHDLDGGGEPLDR